MDLATYEAMKQFVVTSAFVMIVAFEGASIGYLISSILSWCYKKIKKLFTKKTVSDTDIKE